MEEKKSALLPVSIGRRHRNRLIPPRQHVPLCFRERLLRSLNLARTNCKLSLLVAPAGYGKTTVLSQWVDQLKTDKVKVAWCKLTAHESEPSEFMRLVARALHASGVDMEDTGLLLGGDIYIDAALDAVALKLELATQEVVLVLDDFETLQEAAPIDLVDDLAELLPTHAHLVLAARRNPPLKASALHTQGNIRIITPNELAFNADEIRTFLQHCVPAEELKDVAHWTQGWPVAVQLYRSWREQQEHIETERPLVWPVQSVADYLARQIFDSLSEQQQRFIAEIAMLDEIEPEVADYIRDAQDSLVLLRELQVLLSSLVEIAHFEEQPVFRLHPLIAEAVHAIHPIDPERAALLHRRASAWFLAHERQVDAISHAVACKDINTVTDIIDQLYPLHIFLRSGIGELKSIIRHLPASLVEQAPRIQLMLALIHFKSGLFSEALTLVKKLARCEGGTDNQAVTLENAQPVSSQFQVERLALLTMFRIYVGDCDQSIDRDLEQLSGLTEIDPLMWAWRLNLMIVIHQQRGGLKEAEQDIEQCEAIYNVQSMRFASFQLASHRILLNLAYGSLRQTSANVGKILKRRRVEFKSDVPVFSLARLAEATVSYERRPSVAMEEVIIQALEQLGDSECWFDQRAIAAPILADIAYYRGGAEAVEEFAERWRDWARRRTVTYLDTLLPLLTARYLLISNRPDDAQEILRQTCIFDAAIEEVCLRWRERDLALHTLALYHLVRENFDAAENQANGLIQGALEGKRLRAVISGRVLSAYIKYVRGDKERGLSKMLHAVRDALPEGYVMPFTEMGLVVKPLLEELIQQPAITALEKQHIELTISSYSLQPFLNLHGLSQHEIDILRHLSDGASNKLIARRIGISDNTVKYHLKSAFQKLGVSGRKAASAAFEQAREAGYYP